MTTLQQDLRALVANHGFEMVHSTLQEMMRQDYEFLSKIFKMAPVAVATVPVPAPAPTPSPAVPVPVPVPAHVSEPPTQTTNQPTKKVMKITVRKAVEQPLSSPVPPPMPPTPAPIQLEETPSPEESPVNTLEMPANNSKFRSPAEVKRFQKEAELKKRAELDAKGISVASLMTRDNLKKWIEDDGKTYAAVARDIIGCAETLVSTMAKNYGIQSKNSKRRAFIAGRI
jgi:hypothetical protein